MTYAQIGARLGISAEAARILARRRGWQRIQANRRGAPTLVVVPEDELAGEDWARVRQDVQEVRADEANRRLAAALALAAEANARVDRGETALVRERDRAAQAERTTALALAGVEALTAAHARELAAMEAWIGELREAARRPVRRGDRAGRRGPGRGRGTEGGPRERTDARRGRARHAGSPPADR